MGHVSKQLEEAVVAVSKLPAEQQNLIALEIIERARALGQPPTKLTADERSALEAELAAARRGELASDADVALFYAKFDL